ncbi:MAG: SHOCT domain-containing protein [Verrucomicrobiota bacterium JB023]|nr:SHOCT domain-containing protein [Verrucomicrobiota bacterium JB023]
MNSLTPDGQQVVNDIANRYGLSFDSVLHMLVAVNNGGGTMAQFSIPEYGSGQWMRGGMTMVGDLFNNALKANVNNLCEELSSALATRQIFRPQPQGQGGNHWWPVELGTPSSTGAQNNSRYAIFPQTRRLAVQRDGQVSIFDTMDHQIGGVSQQQGSNDSLTFTSQFGTFTTLSLPLVSGPGLAAPSQAPLPPAPPQPDKQVNEDIYENLRKLGELRDAGVLTDEEFNNKKSELLARL